MAAEPPGEHGHGGRRRPPRRTALRLIVAAAIAVVSGATVAQPADNTPREPEAILALAKAASGGTAWDALARQHSRVQILSAGLAGSAERWSDIDTGRSYLRYSLGPIAGTMGYDGRVAWSQDPSGESRVDSADAARELAVNAAYRDRLGFWFPSRQAATLRYKGRTVADGADFDVVAITPAGGREFELWVNTRTRMIERLVEREASATRTELYMDWRDVSGVKIPFRVRTSRGDPKFDEVVNVEDMEFNGSLAGIDFARPAPPRPDFAFPAGKAAVELPFEIHNGHLYVRVRLNGTGTQLMLFDATTSTVLTPETARALAQPPRAPVPVGTIAGQGEDQGAPRIAELDFGGITLERQAYATFALNDLVRRVEGLDAVGGALGYEIFRRFPVRIDYQRFRLTVYDPATFRYQGDGIPVPFRLKGRIPEVDAAVDGIEGVFGIDIGSRNGLTLAAPFAQRHALAARYGARQEVIAGAGPEGHTYALLARASILRIGDIAVHEPVTYLSTASDGTFADPDIAGRVGYGILRRFNITFDFAHGRLYFEKNANYAERDVHDRAGVWMERGDRGFELIEVVPGSPADAAGLKAGDVVVAVDGKPAAGMPLSQLRLHLRSAPGTKVRLKLESGETRQITLRDLV
jgi:hypothetical protein